MTQTVWTETFNGAKHMANHKQAAAKRLTMAERAEAQLTLHFPAWPEERLWRRKKNDGFTTLPRTLPLVMQAVDAQSKGQPAGHTLFCLWARSPDHPLVTIENPATFASEAGFDGERAVDTWRRRMKRLQELQLIQPKKGPSGDFHHVLLLNPNVAVEWMYKNNFVQSGLYGRFIDRLYEVGGSAELVAINAYWVAQAAAKTATPPVPTTVTPPVTASVTPAVAATA